MPLTTAVPDVLAPLDPLADAGIAARNGLTVQDAEQMLRVLKLPAILGEEFDCVLPGPDGRVSVIDPTTLRYQTLSPGAPRAWFSLAEVYASVLIGTPTALTEPARHARWWSRLRMNAGLIQPHVAALNLPDDLSPAAVRLAYGFALNLALLQHERPAERAVSYSRRFAVQWTQLPEDAVKSALRELRSEGVLVQVGALPSAGRQPTPLYELSAHVTDPEVNA